MLPQTVNADTTHAAQINDRYEFPDELDLDVEDGKFLSPDADRSVRNLYRLHSVLVHSGGVHGGHYYAYIRPNTSGKWLKFDDEKVGPLPSCHIVAPCAPHVPSCLVSKQMGRSYSSGCNAHLVADMQCMAV